MHTAVFMLHAVCEKRESHLMGMGVECQKRIKSLDLHISEQYLILYFFFLAPPADIAYDMLF